MLKEISALLNEVNTVKRGLATPETEEEEEEEVEVEEVTDETDSE